MFLIVNSQAHEALHVQSTIAYFSHQINLKLVCNFLKLTEFFNLKQTFSSIAAHCVFRRENPDTLLYAVVIAMLFTRF